MAAAPSSVTTLGEQLRSLHETVRAQLPGIVRVAVAAYDPKTDRLRTFVHSTEGESPLAHYDVALRNVPSLAALVRSRAPRVIDDLRDWADSPAEHTRALLARGYRSSFTQPLFEGQRFRGFLFFDASEASYFTADRLEKLAWPARLASAVVLGALVPVRVLEGAVRLVSGLSHARDEETGAHLDRMAEFSRLMAATLAPRLGLADEWVEFVFLFAPMHDIGKIAIPDRILHKPGSLDGSELAAMHEHVVRGAEIIDLMTREFGLGELPHVDMLRNIVLYHHEAWDGSGYPHALRGADIPLGARIVAVADVFDALTNERPYKPAWGSHDAFAHLVALADRKFDRACVEALLANAGTVELVRQRFRDDAAT